MPKQVFISIHIPANTGQLLLSALQLLLVHAAHFLCVFLVNVFSVSCSVS